QVRVAWGLAADEFETPQNPQERAHDEYEPVPRRQSKRPPEGGPWRRNRDFALDAQRVEVDRLFRVVPLGLLPLLLVVVEPGSGRDQLADDHVLLEAPQAVHLAADGGL